MTYYCRFSAARRLKAHESLSLWIISAFSIGLIILPISRQVGAQTNSSEAVLLLEVASAIVILVFSIIVNKSNFSHRAEQYHRCGLELNDLDKQLFKLKDRELSDDEYDPYAEKYSEILRRYENHSNLDFYSSKVNGFRDHYKLNFLHRLPLWAWYLLEFSPYLLLLTIQVALFYAAFTTP